MNPMSMDSEDELVHDAPPRELFIAGGPVTYNMTLVDSARTKRARNVVRRFRQGRCFFRLYNSRGPRVEVLAVEAKKGKAVVEGKIGVFAVALCDLQPDDR